MFIYVYRYACNRYEEKLIVMQVLLHRYMESIPHLPALCVCQIESASPQIPGITKNTINCFLARCQSSIATRAEMFRAVATMKSVGLPTRLPRTPLENQWCWRHQNKSWCILSTLSQSHNSHTPEKVFKEDAFNFVFPSLNK